MLGKFVRALYGDISGDELKKFSLLSLTFFFIIGGYWLLRPLKDSIFFSSVGGAYQPKAKMFSVSNPESSDSLTAFFSRSDSNAFFYGSNNDFPIANFSVFPVSCRFQYSIDSNIYKLIVDSNV